VVAAAGHLLAGAGGGAGAGHELYCAVELPLRKRGVRPRGLRAPYSRGIARFPTTDSRSKRQKFGTLQCLQQQACRALLSYKYSFNVTHYIDVECVTAHRLNVELLASLRALLSKG